MIRMEVQRTGIFSEFSEKEQKEYFSCNGNKVVHNIDTLYYSVFLEEDEQRIIPFVESLQRLADSYKEGNTVLSVGEMAFYPFRFSIYEFCLRLENMYDIFISKYLPNKDTPRIVIQLRSIGLWLEGAKNMIKKSLKALQDIIAKFHIEVKKVGENRIDYAYHTNMIQSTAKYFSDKNMLRSLRSEMTIYHKVGEIGRTIGVDYLSLGNRKSNNVFFRAYNKTKEVCEKAYKGFFIEYWYKSGLISLYDKWILEKAYQKGSYNGLLVARIEWYLEHGHNEEVKKELKELYRSCYEKSDNSTFMADRLSELLPEVTIVCNIEFQTKRKFYYTMDEYIKELPSSVPAGDVLYRLLQIVDNPKPFLDYLTGTTVKFVQGDKYASWWQRIRNVKIKSMSKAKLYREYARNLDIQKLRQRMVGTIAAGSIYKEGINDKTFCEDISDMLCILNDNDMKGLIVDTSTGETFKEVEFLNFHYDKYSVVKERKKRQIKAFLNKKKKDVTQNESVPSASAPGDCVTERKDE